MITEKYSVLVVGGGHAGCEAASAAANLGEKTLLITMNLQTIGQMSCNPSMGGIAKGQIVREIDALGGKSGIISDKSMIQFKMLNRSKGPAMWSPRCQSDRIKFSLIWRLMLEKNENLNLFQDEVRSLIIKGNKAIGVITSMGIKIYGKSIILTNGTFLNPLIHIGEKQFEGGRIAEKGVKGLTEQLIELGFKSGRMKTGTSPRIDARTLDFSKMEEQKGDDNPGKFSFSDTHVLAIQKSCYITHTNKLVHEVIREGFEKSPMFNGRIQSPGPRYCPSIEDKIDRFSQRDSHQIFVEPEGWNTIETYINGFSTSLPQEIQLKGIRLIPGFKEAKILRPGYAIEYDYFLPTQLKLTLETKLIENLFLAGQINGTTGYEEAACQGLIAGINAYKKNNYKKELILKREEAYIGVLIDDLVTKGTKEPYRMFTSRAEFRLLLRQDNADERLTPIGFKIGLISKERLNKLDQKLSQVDKLITHIKNYSVSEKEINRYLIKNESSPIKHKKKLKSIIARPNIKLSKVLELLKIKNINKDLDSEIIEIAEIKIKYEGYLVKEQAHAKKISRLEGIKIPKNFNYFKLTSIRVEAKEKLTRIQPSTIGQAGRISGISPSDITVLLIYLQNKNEYALL